MKKIDKAKKEKTKTSFSLFFFSFVYFLHAKSLVYIMSIGKALLIERITCKNLWVKCKVVDKLKYFSFLFLSFNAVLYQKVS